MEEVSAEEEECDEMNEDFRGSIHSIPC